MKNEERTVMTFRSSFLLCLVLAACTKPAARDGDVKDTSENRTGTIGPMSSAVTTPASEPEPAVDVSCARDADCAVKDVGGCCGYTPRCVNAAAKTDPDAARAACAKEGRMATCAFVEIKACACIKARCTPNDGGPFIVR